MEAATAPNAIKPITGILMFPPLSELELKPALLDRRVPGAKGISGVERLCHRKLSWRRDVLILSYRNVGVCRRDASEKRGLAGLRQSPWESVHQDPRINSCGAIAMVFQRTQLGQDLPYDSPSSGTTRSHYRLRPAGGSRWQRIASGLGG